MLEGECLYSNAHGPADFSPGVGRSLAAMSNQETLIEVLKREIREETGWNLKEVKAFLGASDWTTIAEGKPVGRREFDFIVTVSGDLVRPKLEIGKQIASHWLLEDEISLMTENCPIEDRFLVHLLTEAFAYSGEIVADADRALSADKLRC